MKLIVHAVRRLSGFFGIVAAVCLGAACIAVCHMVYVRYVLGASTIWQTEFVLYSVVAATLIGSPYVLAMRGHVNVDLVSHYLGPRARKVLSLFASTLGIAFCVVRRVERLDLLSRSLDGRLGHRIGLGSAALDHRAAAAARARLARAAVPRRHRLPDHGLRARGPA